MSVAGNLILALVDVVKTNDSGTQAAPTLPSSFPILYHSYIEPAGLNGALT